VETSFLVVSFYSIDAWLKRYITRVFNLTTFIVID